MVGRQQSAVFPLAVAMEKGVHWMKTFPLLT